MESSKFARAGVFGAAGLPGELAMRKICPIFAPCLYTI